MFSEYRRIIEEVDRTKVWRFLVSAVVFIGVAAATVLVVLALTGCTIPNRYMRPGAKLITETTKCDERNPVEVRGVRGAMCTYSATYLLPRAVLEEAEQHRQTLERAFNEQRPRMLAAENVLRRAMNVRTPLIVFANTVQCDGEHLFRLHATEGAFCTLTIVFHRAAPGQRNAQQIMPKRTQKNKRAPPTSNPSERPRTPSPEQTPGIFI